MVFEKILNLPHPIKHLTISSLKIIKGHFRQGSKAKTNQIVI
jgi:hypothetical protein